MVLDINKTYRRMMMIIMRRMMMIMMLKTCNGHNQANFESTTSIFCSVIDLNHTYRMIMTMMLMMVIDHNDTYQSGR